jgi:uncharacterized membrane protein YfcA
MTSLVLFPLAIATTWLGVVLMRRFSSERFYLLSYWLMIVVGLKLIFDATRAIS